MLCANGLELKQKIKSCLMVFFGAIINKKLIRLTIEETPLDFIVKSKSLIFSKESARIC